MKQFKTLVAALLASTCVFAQKGVEDGSKYGHGEDSVRCIMNLVQYGDAVRLKHLSEAYPTWRVVFDECPLAKKAVYSDGVKIVKEMYKNTQSEEYYDLLLKVYDQRMQYFGKDKAFPLSYLKGKKAFEMLTYKSKDNDVNKEAIALLEECFKGDPKSIDAAFVQKYMLANVTLYQANIYTAENVVNAYITSSNVIATLQGVETDKTKESNAQVKEQVEQIFAQSGAADVKTIEGVFGPQLEANKDNADWLKRVNKFLSKTKDGDESELFYKTSECLHKIEPAASSARGLARMYLKQSDSDKAIAYYKEAIELETENAEKAKYYYELSITYFSANNYSEAKAAATNAAKLRDDWGAPYILLGKIYATGSRLIGSDEWEKKAGYWAAVDKFAKARSIDANVATEAGQLIGQYSQYFPSREDLFMHGKQDGESYFVGGFISESTTIRSKK